MAIWMMNKTGHENHSNLDELSKSMVFRQLFQAW